MVMVPHVTESARHCTSSVILSIEAAESCAVEHSILSLISQLRLLSMFDSLFILYFTVIILFVKSSSKNSI